jgi:hypothetical protein
MHRSNKHRSTALQTIAGRSTVCTFGGVLLLVVSCSGPMPVDPSEPPQVEWTFVSGAQGILSPVVLSVNVTVGGEPLNDIEVTWRVREGGGLVGAYDPTSIDPRTGMDREVSTRTDVAGRATTWWTMGPRVGAQEVEVHVAGAETLRQRVESLPGVVYVGVWRLAAEQQALLPSDTFRIHVTNYAWTLNRDLEQLAAGTAPSGIGGAIRPGPGVDPAWIFHLDPRLAGLADGTAGLCTSSPPLTEQELAQVLEERSPRLCPWLRFVRVEDVPQAYLDRLAGS